MKEIEIDDKKYKIIEDVKEGFDLEEFKNKYTDYYYDYDYILGDWAYGKLRLKGFNKKGNKNYKPINDYDKVKEYLENYCSYGCKYFIVEKTK